MLLKIVTNPDAIIRFAKTTFMPGQLRNDSCGCFMRIEYAAEFCTVIEVYANQHAAALSYSRVFWPFTRLHYSYLFYIS